MASKDSDEFSRRLNAYPKELLSFVSAGFADAAALTDEQRDLVLNEVLDSFKRGVRRVDAKSLSALAGRPERELERLASVYSLSIGLLSEVPVTPEEFVSAGAGILFDPAQGAVATSIAQAICNRREEIDVSVKRAQLAGEVLPSLTSLDVAIDVRVRFSDGELTAFVPVAVLHVETDAPDHCDLWVQMSAGEIEGVLKKLNQALQDMRAADKLPLAVKGP